MIDIRFLATLFFSMLGTCYSFSQVVHVQIMSEQGRPISYAHIENIAEQTFMVTDHSGEALIDTSFARLGDSLRLSCVGFSSSLFVMDYTLPAKILVLQDAIHVLPEVVKTELKNHTKYNLRERREVSMPMRAGSMLAIQVPLKGQNIALDYLRLFSENTFDSLEVRISVLAELDYEAHTQSAIRHVIRGKKIELKNLALRASSANSTYWLVIEIFPYGKSPFKLSGYLPEKSTQVHTYMRGNIDVKQSYYSTTWLAHGYWVPRLKLGYSY